jgi:hypothetical protein
VADHRGRQGKRQSRAHRLPLTVTRPEPG